MTLEAGGFRLGFQEWSPGNITELGNRGAASSGLVREAEGQKATTGLSNLGKDIFTYVYILGLSYQINKL